jgi:hypothetical protein
MTTPRRGRPTTDPNGRPSAAVHLKIAPTDYDRAYRHARERRESIQDVIRRGLRRILTDERSL